MNPSGVYILYLIFAAGAVALVLLLPRGDQSRVAAGAVVGLPALAGLMALLAARGQRLEGSWFFYLFGTIALLAAVRMITHTKPVYSAIYFVLVVVATAALLLLQSAEFLAVALVIIYAGAILVTYLFVIMLAQQALPTLYDRRAREPMAAVVVGFVLVAIIAARAGDLPAPPKDTSQVALAGQGPEPAPPFDGNTLSLGRLLMTKYLVVLELSGILLLVSMVGAIALSRKRVAAEFQPPQRPLGEVGKEAVPF